MPTDQWLERLEAFILGICNRYLLLDELADRDLFSEEQVAIAELPQEYDLFNDDEEPVNYNPICTWELSEQNMIRFDPTEHGFGEFFVYASCYWLDHFGAVRVAPLASLANIEDLCHAGSTRLRNGIQQKCRPGCAITPRFQFYSSLYDPLSITSLYGSVPILRDMLKNLDLDKDAFLPNPAIGAANTPMAGDVPGSGYSSSMIKSATSYRISTSCNASSERGVTVISITVTRLVYSLSSMTYQTYQPRNDGEANCYVCGDSLVVAIVAPIFCYNTLSD